MFGHTPEIYKNVKTYFNANIVCRISRIIEGRQVLRISWQSHHHFSCRGDKVCTNRFGHKGTWSGGTQVQFYNLRKEEYGNKIIKKIYVEKYNLGNKSIEIFALSTEIISSLLENHKKKKKKKTLCVIVKIVNTR